MEHIESPNISKFIKQTVLAEICSNIVEYKFSMGAELASDLNVQKPVDI